MENADHDVAVDAGNASTTEERRLTEDETKKLDDDVVLVSEFKRAKLEREARKNWDLFYKRNGTNFFKDRHWTTREFHDLTGRKVGCDLKLIIIIIVFLVLFYMPNDGLARKLY